MIKSNTLTFEQMEPALRKWANHFHNKYPNKFEFWELINSAWSDGTARFLPQSKIKYASRRVRFDMLDYMRLSTRHRAMVRSLKRGLGGFPFFHNLSSLTPSSCTEDGNDFEVTFEAESIDIEGKDFVCYLTNHPSLSRLEKLLMKSIYIDNCTQEEVGRACGLAESRISQIHTNLMARLRCLDYTKITGRTECQQAKT